jgi:DNA-binding transcriptional ArsR family regulator
MSCVLKTITDPRRRAILRALGGGPLRAEDLRRQSAVELPELADHLAALRRSGLVREQGDEQGGGLRYVLAREPIHELAVFLRAVAREV